jgi:GcrA cell cycle regulator
MADLQEKHVVSTITTITVPTHPDQSRRSTRSTPRASRMPPPLTPKALQFPVGSQPADEQSPLILPNGNFVTTLTLNSRTCRWPVGDPTESGFHYCGQPPKSPRPYCDAHERKSYQPVRSRPIHRPRLP